MLILGLEGFQELLEEPVGGVVNLSVVEDEGQQRERGRGQLILKFYYRFKGRNEGFGKFGRQHRDESFDFAAVVHFAFGYYLP